MDFSHYEFEQMLRVPLSSRSAVLVLMIHGEESRLEAGVTREPPQAFENAG